MKLVNRFLVGAWLVAIPSIFLVGTASGMKNMAQDAGISKLPGEVISEIFEYLHEDDLMQAALVCKSWTSNARRALVQIIKKEREKLVQKYGSLHAALYHASMYGLMHELRFLVGLQEIDINRPMGICGSAPLIVATVHKHLPVVRYLIERGKADVSKYQNDGSTSLSLAAYLGYADIVAYLVESTCVDVLQSGKDGFSPFMWAVGRRHFGVAQYLAHHGADINEGDRKGRNALMAMVLEKNVEGVKCLVELGADLDCVDDKGHTVVELAQQSNSDEILQFLLQAKKSALAKKISEKS